MTTKIIIRERWDDYMAFVEGNPGIWGCGKRVSDAIRDLVLTHKLGYDLEVKYEMTKDDCERLKEKIEWITQRKEKSEKGIR